MFTVTESRSDVIVDNPRRPKRSGGSRGQMSYKKKKRAAELRCCLYHISASVRPPIKPLSMSIRRHRALRGSSLFYSLFYPLAQSLRRLRSLDRGYPRHRHSVAPGLCAGWMVWRTHCHSVAPRLCAGWMVWTSLLRGSVAGSLSDDIAHSEAPRLCAGCLVGTVWWTHRALRSSQTDFFLFSYLFPCFSCRMALYWFCLRSGFGKRQFLPFPPFFRLGHIILHT